MDQMKKYKQLIKELPAKKVVFAFGRFNPPTTGHELLVKTVKKLASTGSADHAIYASKTQDAKKNPLSVDKKVQYLGKMFPSTKFVAADQNVRTYIEAVKELNKKYKNLVMVAGSDRVQAYQELLNKYNGKEFHFDTIEVVSAGERDPDADDASGMSGTKMRTLASKGDYASFKKGLPSTLRDIDGKLLMNDVRLGMGIEAVKEQVRFDVDALREEFFKGKIYTVGQFVESDNQRYEILDRGSNYLVLVNSTGETCKKWIQDVTLSEDQLQEDVTGGPAPEQITFKGYTTKNFGRTADAAKAFQDTIARASEKDPVAVLNALKSTDTYMGINDRHIAGEELTDSEITQWKEARVKAQESLARVGEFMHHMDYFHMHEHELEGLLTNFKDSGKGEFMEALSDKTLRPTDKIKVARIIATMLGVDKVEATSNPELLVNTALRRIKNKTLNPEALNIVNKMLALANEMGIDYDTNLIPQKLQVTENASVVKFDPKKTNNIAQGIMTFDDYQKLKTMTNKAGHSFGHADNDNLRKMKVKHMTEASALERFRAAAAEREKKHDEIERKRKEAAAQGKENMSGAIDRLEKALKESHVEFRIDHRDKATGDHKSTFADHEAKVSDTTDKATYVKVPAHKADSFKSAMKSKHGVRIELAEEVTEAKMTDGDMKERERIVKGMKKNITGFKARYGKDAESVMYATATKQAMKEEAVDMAHIEDHKETQEQNVEDQLMAELNLTDEQIDHIVNSAQEDDFIEEYDENELSIVDEDSGEEIPEEEYTSVNEEKLMEVLSKIERIRARLRFAKTKGKRERKAQIALRTRSTNAVANKRARRLAIKLMKNRLLRGRDANKISIGEKERIERIIQKRKAIVGRIAVKLVPRIRQIEKARLSNTKFTKGAPNVAF